jgi:hypothetical protein
LTLCVRPRLSFTVVLEGCMFSWQVKQAETILAVNHREGSVATAGLPFSSSALCWVWTGSGKGIGHAWVSCGAFLWSIPTRITRDLSCYSKSRGVSPNGGTHSSGGEDHQCASLWHCNEPSSASTHPAPPQSRPPSCGKPPCPLGFELTYPSFKFTLFVTKQAFIHGKNISNNKRRSFEKAIAWSGCSLLKCPLLFRL